MSDQHDPFEEQLRAALRGGSEHPDVDAFLGEVHRGAARRRTRRIVAGTAAAVCLVAAGGFAVSSCGVLDQDGAQVADQTAGTTLGTEASGTPQSGEPSTSPSEPSPSSSEPTDPEFAAEDVVALDVTAVDSRRQYLLGSVPAGDCGQKRCPRVLATDDAGVSWSDLGELPAHLIRGTEDSGSVGGLRFAADDRNGWAFRGALLSTHDGGESWTQPDLPVRSNVLGVEVAGDHVLALAYNGETAVMLRSPIDSDDWELVPLAEQLGGDRELLSVMDVAADPEVAMMTATSAPDFVGELLVSTDDGATWAAPPSTDYCDLGPEGPSRVGVVTGALWVGCQNRNGRAEATPAVSTDGGESWERTGGSFADSSLLGPLDDSSAIAVEPANPNLGTGGARVFRTSLPADSTPTELGTFGDGTPSHISFVDSDTGFLVFASDGGIWRTADGGESWAPYEVTQLD